MERKGQGALEYLLLIGGAVLIAVIVITLLLGLGGTSQGDTELTAAQGICNQKMSTLKLTDPNAGDECSVLTSGASLQIGSNLYNCTDQYPNCSAEKASAAAP